MEKIGLLITGNEILSGKVLDTNTQFLASSMRELGFYPSFSLTCSDDLESIQQCLQFLSAHCDTIVVTGGLGPTTDDRTAEAVGALLKRDLIFNTEAWNICVSYFHNLGRTEIPATNQKQAMLPKDCRILPNPNGTAAGFCVQHMVDGCDIRIFCLPGVPREMEPMFSGFVLPEICVGILPCVSRSWKIFLLGESEIQARLFDLEMEIKTRHPTCSISYQAQYGIVTWALTMPVDSQEKEYFAHFIEEHVDHVLQNKLAPYLLYSGDEKIHDHLINSLIRKKLVISAAESCTGGLLAQSLTSVPGASRAFNGSAITYSNESKTDVLGVDARTIERNGAVSTAVAYELAVGSQHVFSSDLSVAVTGVAGPGGGTPIHPVGNVCFGLSINKRRIHSFSQLCAHLKTLGWSIFRLESTDINSSHREVTFVSEKKFGSHLTRENIQIKSVAFSLGTAISTLPYLE